MQPMDPKLLLKVLRCLVLVFVVLLVLAGIYVSFCGGPSELVNIFFIVCIILVVFYIFVKNNQSEK